MQHTPPYCVCALLLSFRRLHVCVFLCVSLLAIRPVIFCLIFHIHMHLVFNDCFSSSELLLCVRIIICVCVCQMLCVGLILFLCVFLRVASIIRAGVLRCVCGLVGGLARL